jgi:hypothetical protein
MSDLTVAVRSNESGSGELSYLVTDRHGTATLAIYAADQAYSRHYTTRFGAPRATTTGAAWPRRRPHGLAEGRGGGRGCSERGAVARALLIGDHARLLCSLHAGGRTQGPDGH